MTTRKVGDPKFRKRSRVSRDLSFTTILPSFLGLDGQSGFRNPGRRDFPDFPLLLPPFYSLLSGRARIREIRFRIIYGDARKFYIAILRKNVMSRFHGPVTSRKYSQSGQFISKRLWISGTITRASEEYTR